jgi:hypothetical protein
MLWRLAVALRVMASAERRAEVALLLPERQAERRRSSMCGATRAWVSRGFMAATSAELVFRNL